MVTQMLSGLLGEGETVIEFVEFTWEVLNLCTFVCEEAIQALNYAVTSALNYGRADYADAILKTAYREVVETYLTYALLLAAFLFPGVVGYAIFADEALFFMSHAEEVAEQVEAMPGMRRYPGFTRYGRFF